MIKLFFAFLRSLLLPRSDLLFENVALRHQLTVLQRSAKRPRLRQSDRICGLGCQRSGQVGVLASLLSSLTRWSDGIGWVFVSIGDGSPGRSEPGDQRFRLRSENSSGEYLTTTRPGVFRGSRMSSLCWVFTWPSPRSGNTGPVARSRRLRLGGHS